MKDWDSKTENELHRSNTYLQYNFMHIIDVIKVGLHILVFFELMAYSGRRMTALCNDSTQRPAKFCDYIFIHNDILYYIRHLFRFSGSILSEWNTKFESINSGNGW